jgi:hypothetical protein
MSGFYVVGSWLIIQVADVFFPAWGLPETALRFLIVATILCFPTALIFAWTFDITSSGIVKTAPAHPGELLRRGLKIDELVDDLIEGLRRAGLENHDSYAENSNIG